ncbi:MAG TPA: hotdog domain-containing protein [Cyclobacteriaceae bacterium]|nr:hotdog domain-containing protein [Cyclobacteriaceae bacterium]HRX00853.1 hotdog domain-containing protein [Cyclobacteriaceae bacterium]
MREIFKPGDQKKYERTVEEQDQAIFHGEVLHAVCSTFALARDMEWSSRLFFIEMKEEDEEGVGTHLSIDHFSPAFVGEKLSIVATVSAIDGNELMCDIEVKVGDRVVARGKTGQRMLKKERLKKLFEKPK